MCIWSQGKQQPVISRASNVLLILLDNACVNPNPLTSWILSQGSRIWDWASTGSRIWAQGSNPNLLTAHAAGPCCQDFGFGIRVGTLVP